MLSAASPLTIGIVASILTKEYLLGKLRTNGVNHVRVDVFCLIFLSLSKIENTPKGRPLTRMSRVQTLEAWYLINAYS